MIHDKLARGAYCPDSNYTANSQAIADALCIYFPTLCRRWALRWTAEWLANAAAWRTVCLIS